MSRVPYWIQKADLSVTEHEPVDAAGACAVLGSHDWEPELALRDRLEQSGVECCDPGVGFHRADGEILHICPTPDDRATLFYHFREVKRFLGLFPSERDRVHHRFGVERSALPQVVERWFAGDTEWLVDFFDSGSRGGG